MKHKDNREDCPDRKPPLSSRERDRRLIERYPEDDPAGDRGKRIASDKAIARGGKSTGDVPGARVSSGR